MATTFLVPQSLTWDKLCALFIHMWAADGAMPPAALLNHLKVRGHRICFQDEGDVPEDCVDVDVIEPYNRDQRIGSATEKAVDMYGLDDLPGASRLIELMNANNRTGYLKESDHSLVALIRELNKVGTAHPSIERRLHDVAMLWIAVRVYFLASDIEPESVARLSNPFTVKNMVLLMGKIGVADQAIIAFQAHLDNAFAKTDNATNKAQEKALSIQPVCRFAVKVKDRLGQHVAGHVIQTDDTRVPAQYMREHLEVCVLVNLRRSGNVAIMCRGEQDFTLLFEALEGRDPGRWYLFQKQGRSPMVLNGSTSRSAPPTQISLSELVTMIIAHHEHRSRRA